MLVMSVDRFFNDSVRPYLQSRQKKPTILQIREMLRLYRTYEYVPYHYLKHCLYIHGSAGRWRTTFPRVCSIIT